MPTEGRLSREEDERLMALSIIPFIPIFICVVAYFAHLKSIGVIPTFQTVVQYALSTMVLCLAAGFGTYEVVSSFKVKRPLSFRAKRFLSRMALASACFLCIYVLWILLTLLLSSVLNEKYILLLSFVTTALAIFILTMNPSTKRLIKKLTQEER